MIRECNGTPLQYSCLENPGRDGNTRPPDLTLDKSVCRSGSNWTWLDLDMEQQTGSK